MAKWVWSIDGFQKVRQSWIDEAPLWRIECAGDQWFAYANDGTIRVPLFGGTAEQCKDYIDKQTK